ncbi:phosphate ABC transporter substrate-binding protein [candidate division WOR-3 bacterium]|nr:phosphate ABC transporter substrate-binding protein [candidate division WOR-3 bacterium]MCK4528202.1 phosphate ABC transporter substrate-binding protein [candidate division WOR-3 bacterium]
MVKKLKFSLLVFTSLAATIFLASTSLYAASKKITITGSTTVLPIAQRAAEAYMDIHKDISISVRGGGSGVGIAALIDGRADIADASRPIKTKELKTAREKGINPYANIVAKDGIAVVVHPDNPVNVLSLEELKKIYTGEITSWKEVGGLSKPIVVISRDFASGTFEVFKKLVLGGAKVKDRALMLASNKAVATTVTTTPDAIGYIGLGYLSDNVKALKINEVMPTNETVNDDSYKLARPLFMYTNGKPKGLIKSFIDFVLSLEGQKIIEEAGFVPVK